MRDAFHEELDAIQATLVTMGEMVSTAMSRSSEALLNADVKLAEQVISDDEKLDTIQHDLEARSINLMARQQPVAQDLRILVTSLRMSADLERMGDLCHHIAKLARMRYPEVAVPAELVKTIESMGTTAVKIIEKASMEPEEKALLRTEIAVLKLVNHPNIIKLEGLYETRCPALA